MKSLSRVDLTHPRSSRSAIALLARQPHQMEQDVRRRLLSEPELCFSSLVIRRLRDGVCLEGVLESNPAGTDVSDIARTVAGVDRVVNCLVVRNGAEPRE